MHIGNALVFELSKVEKPAIRERLVSHLPHIDAELSQRVTELGLKDSVKPAKPAREPLADLEAIESAQHH